MIGSDEVGRAALACAELLRSTDQEAWDTPDPELGRPVAGTVAHIAQCCIWYTVDLTAGGQELEVIHPQVDADGPPGQLITAVEVCSTLLVRALDSSAPTDRGFHPFGSPDPSGFAAMGCDEILVHTNDVATAMGVAFEPDADLAAGIVGRLFPWAPPAQPAWETLLWCNGRIALDEHPRLERWRWHCVPIDDWDGSIPSFVR